jgi:hypothetical protein
MIPAVQIGGRWRIKKSALDHDILRRDKQGGSVATLQE